MKRHNPRISHVQRWRSTTHTLGTLVHTHTRSPARILTCTCHFLLIFSLSCPGEFIQAQDFLFPPPLPSLPTPASPTPEKVQLRGPQGCTGNALHTTGQPGYFLSQNWREVGPGAASHDTVSCFLPLSLWLFPCLYNLQSVFLCVLVS